MAKRYQWTRVEHELPDDCENVLVWGPDHSVVSCVYYGEPHLGFFWDDSEGLDESKIDWVTHWVSYPKPPNVNA